MNNRDFWTVLVFGLFFAALPFIGCAIEPRCVFH